MDLKSQGTSSLEPHSFHRCLSCQINVSELKERRFDICRIPLEFLEKTAHGWHCFDWVVMLAATRGIPFHWLLDELRASTQIGKRPNSLISQMYHCFPQKKITLVWAQNVFSHVLSGVLSCVLCNVLSCVFSGIASNVLSCPKIAWKIRKNTYET